MARHAHLVVCHIQHKCIFPEISTISTTHGTDCRIGSMVWESSCMDSLSWLFMSLPNSLFAVVVYVRNWQWWGYLHQKMWVSGEVEFIFFIKQIIICLPTQYWVEMRTNQRLSQRRIYGQPEHNTRLASCSFHTGGQPMLFMSPRTGSEY